MELTSSLAKRRIFSGAAAAGLATSVAVFGFGPQVKAEPPTQTTSVILISGDGLGVQQRTAIQYANYGIVDERQPMDSLPYAGFLDTIQDGKTAVTDSAAGATAWSTRVSRPRTASSASGATRSGSRPSWRSPSQRARQQAS